MRLPLRSPFPWRQGFGRLSAGMRSELHVSRKQIALSALGATIRLTSSGVAIWAPAVIAQHLNAGKWEGDLHLRHQLRHLHLRHQLPNHRHQLPNHHQPNLATRR